MNEKPLRIERRNRNKEAAQLIGILFLVFACHVSKHTTNGPSASPGHASSSSQSALSGQPAPGKQPQWLHFPVFDKEGHRGCRGLMPENTIPAMRKALDLGVTTLEMDAHITGDNQVIISHDPFFNHEITTLPDGTYFDEQQQKQYALYHMSYAETQRFDVGLKFYPKFPRQQKMAVHKPLLVDLIDSVEAYCDRNGRAKPFYNIETKTTALTDNIYHPAPEPFVAILMKAILSKDIRSRVIIQSFDPRTLQILHRQYPDILTSLLINDGDKRGMEVQCRELGFYPSIYSPGFSLVDQALLKSCHEHGMKVIPWTVDDPETIKRLEGLGVDGIITDYPDLF